MHARRIKVFFRADASSRIGSGHVMRCLTLAEELRDAGGEVVFISRAHPGNLNDLIRAKGFRCHELPEISAIPSNDQSVQDARSEYASWLSVSQQQDALESIEALAGAQADWLIIDHYGLDEKWEKLLRPYATKIMVIDDLADRHHDCDLLLDQNHFIDGEKRYDELVSPACTKLLGPKYALLRDEFGLAKKFLEPRSGIVKRIFVFLGGVDSENLSAKVLEALSDPEFEHLEVDIVIGRQNPNIDELKSMVLKRDRTAIHIQVENIAELMGRADLAIGAGGSTTWERLCLGLPTMVIAVAENQKLTSMSLHQEGVIKYIGESQTICPNDIRNSLRQMIGDQARLNMLSQKAFAMVDGLGVKKIVPLLIGNLTSGSLMVRKAGPRDCLLYWHWANDPEVRKSAFHSEQISWDVHQKWFHKMIQQRDVEMFVMESAMGPVGQVRFESNTDGKIISYSVARQFRGMGLGIELLKRAMSESSKSEMIFIGDVKKTNLASLKTFQKLGFEGNELLQKNAIRFTLNYSNQEMGK